MSEKKRGISLRRRTRSESVSESNSPSPIDPDGGSSAPRFSPSRGSVTTGGKVYGSLVANERAKLGLTQRELAARIGTSHSTIARIEQGHPPRPETRKALAIALNAAPTSALHFPLVRKAQRGPRKPPKPPRAPRRTPPDLAKALGSGGKALRDRWKAARPEQRSSPGERPRRARVSPGVRLISGTVALALVAISMIVGGWMKSSGDTDHPSLVAALPVSNALGAPATIHRARVQAQKRAAAEARRAAAERRREREEAAAAAAAAAARRAAKQENRNSAPIAPSAPATPTVSPSPPPSSSGGGGNGGSSGSRPELQHGIGSGGGTSGSGSSTTPGDGG